MTKANFVKTNKLNKTHGNDQIKSKTASADLVDYLIALLR